MTRSRMDAVWWPTHQAPIRRWGGRAQARATSSRAPGESLATDPNAVVRIRQPGAADLPPTTGERTEVWLEIGLAALIIVAIGLIAFTLR